MEIVVTNDDGWGSKGILTLTRLMTQLGHVTVVAPNRPQSGQSNAISVKCPIYLHPLPDPDWGKEAWQRNADVYTTNGTPSDCIKLALNILFQGREKGIDLVVSGINHGSNAAINTLYSGTLGACFVAAEHGIPAIGFSLCDDAPDADFRYFEEHIPTLTRRLCEQGMPYGVCYNVNAPVGAIQGVRTARQAMGHWEQEMAAATDERGEPCYRLVGEFVNHEPDAQDTDEWVLRHGYISIQPCTIDRTAYGQIR